MDPGLYGCAAVWVRPGPRTLPDNPDTTAARPNANILASTGGRVPLETEEDTMKILATILGAAMAGGLATMASIHGAHAELQHHGGAAMMAPQIVDTMVDELLDGTGTYNLTEDQKQKITAVRDRIRSQAEALHAAHDATHEEMKKEWDLATMDKVKMRALVDARVDDLRHLLLNAVDGVVEIHDTLTADQRKALSDRFEAQHVEK